MRFLLILGVALAGTVSGPASAHALEIPTSGRDSLGQWTAPPAPKAHWNLRLETGLDALVHTYPLAVSDTTETVIEALAAVAVSGRSARRGANRWELQGSASLGDELTRQRLEGVFRRLDSGRSTRLRLAASLRGRQYRHSDEYTSSDNLETRTDLRLVPWQNESTMFESRLRGYLQHYGSPSELEVNHRQVGLAMTLRSRGWSERSWSAGLLGSARSYPDSARIDRHTWGAQATFERGGQADRRIRVYHRTDRRLVRDETARPSAWIHLTDLEFAIPTGVGRILGDLQLEGWLYDREEGAYFDSWRTTAFAGYGRGDLLSTRWKLGLAGERFGAGEVPESYTQFGLRGGVDAYDDQLSGSLTLEVGQRLYDESSSGTETATTASLDVAGTTDYLDEYSNTDFTYWEIWLTATWRLGDHFTLDAMANYEPENHTIPEDDSALGYATLRLTWRP